MNNQFSQRISDVLVYSKEEAIRLNFRQIQPEMLLLGILREGSGKAIGIMKSLNADLQSIKKGIEEKLSVDFNLNLSTNDPYDEDVSLNPDAAKIIKIGILEARLLKNKVTDTEHLLLAILKEGDNLAATVLEENNISYQSVYDQLSLEPTNSIQSKMEFTEEEDDEDNSLNSQDTNKEEASYSSARSASSSSTNDTPVLDNFGIDMTRAAADGKLDPVVGREKEIERVAQILSRRKKNNPVLIGEPGVGKSAIVEGLALRIIEKKVSRVLFDKRVLMLDMASVVAGTKYRGQFEERIRSIINELQKNPNIILFIDEIHTIVGAGAAPGSMDAANMLKPALARGDIQCIGATTLDEYRKNIEKDGALERRFQKVIVEPTSAEETLQILKNIKDKYEEHHNVRYTDTALEACVKLADRYITDRFFPDKAIDVLDEAGSRVYLTNIHIPSEIEEQEKLIDEARASKAEAVKSQNFELAASYRDREKVLTQELDEMKKRWEERLKNDRQVVDEEQVAQIVSMMSGIPVQRMIQTETVKLANMKNVLQSKVIAQDAAINTITKAILRSRVGLKDPNKPIGTFMFLGPTGVGKTHLAKQLAKYMFGSSDALIRIDMSEYMEKYSVSRLVGAPPGYVGYNEGGQLTEKVRRKPYSIVLFDEIEKAHADVFNLLLQVMDEGRLTDSNGRTVDFKNTIIIMTSNVGTRQLKDFRQSIGFAIQSKPVESEHSKSIIQKALNKSFAPEFINRIDEVITFEQLSLDDIIQIIDIELDALYKRVENIGFKLQVSDDAKRFIAQKGYDIQFGARPLKRSIQNYLEDGLSELIISSEMKTEGTILVSMNSDNDGLDIKFE